VAAKPGLFEMADGGTLFIDEIGELAGGLQAKMLRVLEDGSMRRIGSVKERRVDVRLLAATNRSMADEVKEGRFREDLYYRINVMALQLPPLRKRTGDIRLLVNQFLGPDWSLDPEALRSLESYDWPGNIRQLINALDRAKIMADDRLIRLENLPAEVAGGDRATNDWSETAAAGDDLATFQRAHIIEILNRENGNKARAARALGVNRRSFYRLLNKHNISYER
jgi:transcriptional regulator with PAS, ATPase and Fis domain